MCKHHTTYTSYRIVPLYLLNPLIQTGTRESSFPVRWKTKNDSTVSNTLPTPKHPHRMSGCLSGQHSTAQQEYEGLAREQICIMAPDIPEYQLYTADTSRQSLPVTSSHHARLQEIQSPTSCWSILYCLAHLLGAEGNPRCNSNPRRVATAHSCNSTGKVPCTRTITPESQSMSRNTVAFFSLIRSQKRFH
ncbi:uncharacterized protein EI90DRAFT_1014975 [Cantharellus anzutake]|uniref:uncharacterized protein n=1 Tax=Cantharellus anzutake TaxID=1750568 RepID=UPI001906F57E|nr:uncharacterized protein EI90DRAFT_1014975 [Cantharellus anzutake]KAF8331374.1 hypothetical protein EI90DRAFT_1014975 [Cantharellus anzutake]